GKFRDENTRTLVSREARNEMSMRGIELTPWRRAFALGQTGRVRAPENAKCSYRYINHRLISYLDPIRARFDQTGSDRRFS
ncbi:hypothetical protein, partial [Brucella anthropi]|uniref:hypothetical protein n=1 Tax=Brucella anthropi TaxID=529 RepID=UPI001AF00A2D